MASKAIQDLSWCDEESEAVGVYVTPSRSQ